MTSPDEARDVERLAREFHEVYQAEAKRQGDVRHHDDYDALAENVKEFDRVLARHVLAHDRSLAREVEALRDEHDKDQERLSLYLLTARKHYLAGIDCDHEKKQDVTRCGWGDWQSEPQLTVGRAIDEWAFHVGDEWERALSALNTEEPTP